MRSHSLQIIMPNQLHASIILCILILQITLSTSSQNPPTPNPPCPDRCNDISIPPPFGTSEACTHNGHNMSFLVSCNQTGLFWRLDGGDIQITNISLDTHQMTILQDVAYECHDDNGSISSSRSSTINLPPNHFQFSKSNKFLVVGCKARGILNGTGINNPFQTSCTTACSQNDDPEKVSCRGPGCCQKSIRGSLSSLNFSVTSYHNYATTGNVSTCIYGVLTVVPKYPTDISVLTDLKSKKVELLLDWSFRNETCEEAKNNTNRYACKSDKSDCRSKPENELGYQCFCQDGYQGNPYYPNGCQDIDECKLGIATKECQHGCENTEGGFSCTCPKGQVGDGRFKGRGCRPGPKNPKPGTAAGIAIGSAIGALLLNFGARSGATKMRYLRRLNVYNSNGGSLLDQQLGTTGEEAGGGCFGGGDAGNPMALTSEEIQQAIDFGNEKRILGRDDEGDPTYKGMLKDGRIVAVKKTSKVPKRAVGAFVSEVLSLLEIDHGNIVNLIGYCLQTEEPLLAYEFVPNGSLFDHIENPREEIPFTWEMRVRIATEVAGAISYLHSGSSKPRYHRDIKSANILLDETFRAKVSYSGTLRPSKGTPGYVDPEYVRSKQFTEKCDVYSFGAVMVELLTGKTVVSYDKRESVVSYDKREPGKSLVKDFLQAMNDNRLSDILDARVADEGKVEDIIAFAELARQCLNSNGMKRPTMKEVEAELERIQRGLNKGPVSEQGNDLGNNNPVDELSKESYMDGDNLNAAEISPDEL